MWELNYHHLYLIYVYRHAYICHTYQIFKCINENLLKDKDYCMYLLLISLDNPETVNIMSVGIIGALVGKESLCPWEDPSTSWKKKKMNCVFHRYPKERDQAIPTLLWSLLVDNKPHSALHPQPISYPLPMLQTSLGSFIFFWLPFSKPWWARLYPMIQSQP